MRENAKRIIDTKRRDEPMRSYLWYVELPSTIDNIRAGESFNINHRITSINVPFPSFETDKEIQGNSYWYFAKSIDIGSITLEVMEYEDGKTFEYFQAWQQMIANDNGTFNSPFHYKRDIKFFRLDDQKNKLVVDVYEGYFISGMSDISNEYEGNGMVKFTITLTGDSVTHTNMVQPNKKLNPEYNRLTQLTETVISAKQFIDSVQKARVSKSSIVELLL